MMAPRNFGTSKKRLNRAKVPRTLPSKADKQDPMYWEKLLSRNKLSMERGRSKKLDYGHKPSELDYDGVRTYVTVEQITELHEWPISLQ